MDEKLYREAFSRLRTSIDENAIADAVLRRRGKGRRSVALILAAALALALAAGAAAARFGGLQALVLKRPEANVSAEDGASPEAAEAAGVEAYEAAEPDVISLQGYSDSPEYCAALEWTEFLREYDPDGDKRAALNSVEEFAEYASRGYAVYSDEMAEKLEEIIERYSLALHSDELIPAGINELRERFGDFAPLAQGGGYYYGDGTLQLDASQRLGGRGEVEYQLRRTVKGVFDTATLNVVDAEQYEQWSYAPARGGTALLALGNSRALILSETDAGFTATVVFGGTDGGFTRADVEELADSLDLTLL